MTQRFQYNTYWASGGVAVDPDTDTSHSSYLPNRYANIGWKAEKPPNEWDNYLYQVTDEKIMWLLQDGLAAYESDVSYAPGSITKVGEVLYKNISNAVILNKVPASNPDVWGVIFGIDADTFITAVSSMQQTLSNHLAADNPHNDNIHDIGGYESTEVFAMFDADTDPRTIKYHTKQRGAVHTETAAQVGTLPVSGGTFIGDVTFATMYFDTSKTKYTQLNPATARAELGINTLALIAVDGGGRAYWRSAGVDYLIVTELNFNSIQIKVNPLFSLPQPLANIDVRAGSLSFCGCSPVTLSCDVASWVAGKGLLLSGANLVATGINYTDLPTTAYFSGIKGDGSFGYEFFDSSLSEFNNLGDFLANTSLGKFTLLQQFAVYPQLTTYQKLSLVK